MAPVRSLLLAALVASTLALAMGQPGILEWRVKPGGSCVVGDTECFGIEVVGPSNGFLAGNGCNGRVVSGNVVCRGTCLQDCDITCVVGQTAENTFKCGCVGGVCGDPHFYNNGVNFDFHGLADHEYALVSDQDFALTAHMVGQDVTSTGEVGTWMSSLGFLYNHNGQTHKVSLGLAKTEDESTTTDTVMLTVNDVEVALFADYSKPGVGLSVAVDGEGVYRVDIEGLASIRVTVSDHTDPEGFHFDFIITSLQISPNVHGVLGQTYQPARMEALQAYANSTVGTTKSYTDSDILEGVEGDYEVSGTFETDFKFNRFVSATGALVTANRKLLGSEPNMEKSQVPFSITMTGSTMQLKDRRV